MSIRHLYADNHDTLVYRLAQILVKLNQGEKLVPLELANEFGVNLRTIQRDASRLIAHSAFCLGETALDNFYRRSIFNLSILESDGKVPFLRKTTFAQNKEPSGDYVFRRRPLRFRCPRLTSPP